MKKFVLFVLIILISSLFSFSLAFALNPPAWVNDGTGADIDYTNNNSSYSANWAAVDFSEASNG